MGVQRAASGSGTVMTTAFPSASRSSFTAAVRVQRGVVLELLPPVGGQALGEVAGPVEQADADQRDAEVGGRLEVVTARMPSPPEYCGSTSVMPNSAEK